MPTNLRKKVNTNKLLSQGNKNVYVSKVCTIRDELECDAKLRIFYEG